MKTCENFRRRSCTQRFQPDWASSLICGLLLVVVVATTGCSVKKFAISKLGDSLASQSTSSFATDDDPELVGEALPFALKLMEGLLEQVPQHRGLLFATSSGFTQYSYVWVQQPADEVEQQDVDRAKVMRLRARKLYLRARDYGIRGLEVKHRGFGAALRRDPKSAVRVARKKDVPLLYWTAASWGAAISVSKDDPDLVADQPIVEALIDRSLQLDPDFDDGAIHGFLINYESARQGAKGDFADRSRQHFERQVELTGGQLASPFILLAETVSISKQDRTEFESLLKRALAIDPNTKSEWRLSNIVMQRRARWLLSREDDLFVREKPEAQNAANN
jgi:predicted anti-sigma-YlaC factor YlaD